MTNKPMLSVERDLLEDACLPERGLSTHFRALAKLRALLDKPAAQRQGEPIKLSDDVREFLQEWIDSSTGGEDPDIDYDFANQLGLLLGPIYAGQPAPVAVVMPELSGEELEFLKSVHAYSGSKLHSCFGEDGSALWPRLEEIGLIKCLGSYKWELTFDAVAMGIKARLNRVKTVAVVMPERKLEPDECYSGPVWENEGACMEARGWNKALDDVARLNEVKP